MRQMKRLGGYFIKGFGWVLDMDSISMEKETRFIGKSLNIAWINFNRSIDAEWFGREYFVVGISI